MQTYVPYGVKKTRKSQELQYVETKCVGLEIMPMRHLYRNGLQIKSIFCMNFEHNSFIIMLVNLIIMMATSNPNVDYILLKYVFVECTLCWLWQMYI